MPTKFANFLNFCKRKIDTAIELRYQFSVRNTKLYKICNCRMLLNAVVINFTISIFLTILSIMLIAYTGHTNAHGKT